LVIGARKIEKDNTYSFKFVHCKNRWMINAENASSADEAKDIY